MTTTATLPAERGLRLLTKKVRAGHPRHQVATLRRIAVRATLQADWLEVGLGRRFAHDYTGTGDPESFFGYLQMQPDRGEAEAGRLPALRAKAEDALAACLFLNREHALGFPVQ
jgi:hypothetical protein